ncbi:MAG: hypothetical protein JNM28_05175 [Armatimonadetes bacterium]|nr:hypothetical protein [Armatimonadota bacterium]MBS1712432.1 hypothetical protein [Armatimonadota bacterium]MBX3109259.1 hypothetical protein [Fimbriimonadaceae bacterium]
MSATEYNDILWQLAEHQDAKQIDAFLKQHPELKGELQSRINMIAGLKGVTAAPKRKPERFMPSARPLSAGPPRWAAALAAAILVAGAVFATLGTLRFIESRNAPEPTYDPGQIKPGIEANNGNPQSGGNSLPNPVNNPPTTTGPGDTPPIQAERPVDRRVTLVARQTSLSAALNDVGIQAGIRLESAPGMPDPTIAVDFRDLPALQVLEKLGAELGFTASVQSPDSILLIPARDPNAPGAGTLPGFVEPNSGPGDPDSGLQPIPTGRPGAGEPADRSANR